MSASATFTLLILYLETTAYKYIYAFQVWNLKNDVFQMLSTLGFIKTYSKIAHWCLDFLNVSILRKILFEQYGLVICEFKFYVLCFYVLCLSFKFYVLA